jgi:hypothetical protein
LNENEKLDLDKTILDLKRQGKVPSQEALLHAAFRIGLAELRTVSFERLDH